MLTKIAITAASLIFSAAGFSQNILQNRDANKRKEFNLPSFDQPIVINDSVKLKQQLREAYLRKNLSNIQDRYSHNTLKGKIIVLPPDNMPCLVPDMEQTVTMPNAKPAGVEPAPMPGSKPGKRPPLNR